MLVERQRDAPAADDSASDDAAVACSPHAVTTTLTWHPPRAFNPSACTASEVDGFIQSCLLGSRAVCDAFRKQNPGCAACAYTTTDDPAWGPIVDNRTTDWVQLNKGGCIAATSGDADEKGCGGSWELYDQCLNETCSGCFPIKTDTKALAACENNPQTDTICAEYIAQGNVKCPKGGTPSTAKCFTTGGSFADNANTYVTFWCSTVADADAGDAATD